jgi:glycine oxidase
MTALELVRADGDLRVAVIGPAQRPGAASAAAGAMISACGEINHRSLSSEAGREKFQLALKALEMWPSWLDGLNEQMSGDKRLSITDGTFIILNSQGGELDNLNFSAIQDAARGYDQKLELLRGGCVPGLTPAGATRPLQTMYLPNEGSIDAREVLSAVASVASRMGVTFLDETVTGWKQSPTRATSVVTNSGGEVHADSFLVAAGAHTYSLLLPLEDKAAPLPPVLAGKGLAVSCRDPAIGFRQVVRTPNRAGGCGLHMVSLGDNVVYLGATNNLRFLPDEDTTIGLTHFLLDCAMNQLDIRFFQSEILAWYKGNRPAAIDGFPLIGSVWQDNVWVLTGTYRDGFHCSPVLAGHTAATMLGREGMLGDHRFTPLRKPLRTMTAEDAIDEAELHSVSQFYEFSLNPPMMMGVPGGIARRSRLMTITTYQKLNTDFGLSPDIIELLNWSPDKEASIKVLREYFARVS